MKRILIHCCWLALVLTACQSGGHKQAAGPGGGGVPVQPQAQPTTVLVRGNVANPVIPWTEDLTLARAILAAEYRSTFDPRTIIVVRQGQAYQIDPRQLLRGKEDPALLPGDIIELR